MKDSQLGAVLTEACRDERGGTAIEYAVIGALVSIMIIGAVSQIGDEVYEFFETVYEAISG